MSLLFFASLPRGAKKALVWAASVCLFYTACGFFILPLVVRVVAVKQLSKQLGRSVTIHQVRLNPFILSATIRGMLVRDKDGEPLVSWNEAYANFQLASFFGRAWIFKEVRFSQPFVRVQMSKDYTLTFSDIVEKLSKSVAPRPSGKVKGRALRIDRLRFVGARAALTDLTPRVPFQRTIGPFEMTLTHFRTDSDNKNAYALSGITDGGERIAWQGFFFLSPLRTEGELSIEGICLTKYAPLYQDAARFEIKDGVLDLHSTFRYENSAISQCLSASNTTFVARSLLVSEKATGQTALEVSRFEVTGANMDARARRAEVDAVTMTGGRLYLRRNQDTSVNAIELAKPADAAPNAPGGLILLLRVMTNAVAMLLNTTNLSAGVIRNLNLTNCALHLEDLVTTQPVRLNLDEIAVTARNLSNRAGSNLTAEVKMRWQTNGTVRAGITAALAPPSAEVKLALDKLDLQPLAAYLEPHLNIVVLGSKLGLDGTVRLRSTKEELPEVKFHGDARLDDFSTAGGIETESLIQWKSLRIAGIEANLNPPVVSATKATLEDVSARLIIETNRTINLMSALRWGGTNAPAPRLAAKGAAAAVRPKVSVGSVVLSNVNVHFIDRTLRPNVNINLEQLTGTVAGLSPDNPERAVVDLRGTVDKTARATVTGRVNPWNQRQPTELKITLQAVNLLPGDPYSCKYLGYQLKQGTLSLDLIYLIAEQKLKSQNRITLDQLVLGEKVESPEATKLPVRLVIAVLKDRNGRIELEVPVDGNLADPDFHLGKVISSAIGSVFNKIATSPFSALNSLFGGKGEALSLLEFEPGSTHLLPASSEKLDALVNGLSERPELQLEIEGSADPKFDLEALHGVNLRNQDRLPPTQAKARTNENREARTTLSAVTGEKGGAALMRMGTPLDAPNPLDRQGSPLETGDIPLGELPTLAAERARHVKEYILQSGKVSAERISILKATRSTPAKGPQVFLRLQ